VAQKTQQLITVCHLSRVSLNNLSIYRRFPSVYFPPHGYPTHYVPSPGKCSKSLANYETFAGGWGSAPDHDEQSSLQRSPWLAFLADADCPHTKVPYTYAQYAGEEAYLTSSPSTYYQTVLHPPKFSDRWRTEIIYQNM